MASRGGARSGCSLLSCTGLAPFGLSTKPGLSRSLRGVRATSKWNFKKSGTWRVPGQAPPFTVFLVDDNWDDWSFRTLFQLHAADSSGIVQEIGSVKIARFGMLGGTRTQIPESFGALDDEYFSLGQDAEYYEKLLAIGGTYLAEFFRAMRDIAADEQLYDSVMDQDVTQTSLLRSVSPVTVEGQFRRLARGEARTIEYDFAYRWDGLDAEDSPNGLTFSVVPDANPPTNIHALIGGNGVGKTWILNQMSKAAAIAPARNPAFGVLELADGSTDFSGQVSVSFSAFDELDTADSGPERRKGGIPVTKVGLKRSEPGPEGGTKSSGELSDDFAKSLARCAASSRDERWLRAVEMLQTDPFLATIDFAQFLTKSKGATSRGYARATFHKMSSGHKIVVLTLTRLVETLEERTLVLLDEPETHLHPPLLGAFVSALSSLLAETNGVAIAATHSPVVLQEIPRSCVWVVDRGQAATKARRPRLETFGENVGELTHEVFGLEVTESGYHSKLTEASREHGSYQAVVESFRGQLGTEGRSIARALTSMLD